MIFTKTRKEFEHFGLWDTKNMSLEKILVHEYPLARKYTNRIFQSKDGTTSMKIVNYIERHNLCWNDLLTKSHRTEIQTYKVEERTFGTPCNNAASNCAVDNFKVKKLFWFLKNPYLFNIIVDWIPFFTNVFTSVFNISQFFKISRI